MNRIRVLHILNELKPSGAELMLHVAAPLWRGKKIDGEILCTGETRGVLTERLIDQGYVIHHIPFSHSPRFAIRVFKFLRHSKYDVVHVHTERGCLRYEVAAYLSGTKVIFRTVHFVFDFSGLLRLRLAIGRAIARWLGVESIAVGDSVRKNELKRFGNRVLLVHNWFDAGRFVARGPLERAKRRADLGLGNGELVLISLAGDCRPVKNHENILRALALIPDAIYLHVGDDTGTGERALANDLGIQDRVRWVGPVSDPEKYLQAADIYVMPSQYEGLSCAAIEAMAAGVPVVFSRIPGLTDFESICPGIVWCDCSAASIADAIRELIAIGDEGRQHIGAALSSAAHRNFDLSNGAVRYAELYRTAVMKEGAV